MQQGTENNRQLTIRVKEHQAGMGKCSFQKNAKFSRSFAFSIYAYAFFYKERKGTQRTQRSFIKNVKECKERNVLL